MNTTITKLAHSRVAGVFPFSKVDDARLILLSAGLEARVARVGRGDSRLSRYGSNRSSGDVVDETPLAPDGTGGDDAVLVLVVVLAWEPAVDSVPADDERWRLRGDEPIMPLADILRLGGTDWLVALFPWAHKSPASVGTVGSAHGSVGRGKASGASKAEPMGRQ